jgi:hypothetical protein
LQVHLSVASLRAPTGMDRAMATTADMVRVTMADMPQPTMADMRRTMVTGTAIGECIVQPTRPMVDPAIMAVGIEVGVTAGKCLAKERDALLVCRSLC